MRTQKMAKKVARLALKLRMAGWQARDEGWSDTAALLHEAGALLAQAREGLKSPAPPHLATSGEDYGSPFTD